MQAPEPSSGRRKQDILRQALMRKTPLERAAFLEDACGGDMVLRVEMEALLANQEAGQKGPALNAAAGNDFPEPGTPELTPTLLDETPMTEGPGTVIGRYKLLEQIGEGGMGTVWVAEQIHPIRREVALKVIKLGMDTRQVVARFEAERQALALMDHPNIAKVLDAGATATGRPYFVMERVKGIPITHYCDQHNLSTVERLDLFAQVCHAIQHAHQKGIIHRDIKPSNILVGLQDGVPVPKVIDFGIAKATAGQRLTELTLHTALTEFIGTPAYMSPEQAAMTGVDIDTRSDIYALGVLLYELLTGKTPFDAKTLVAAGLEEMRRIIREQEPVRPSTRLSTMVEGELTTMAKHRHSEPPKLIHLVRGDLDWIVMKCLEKDRARRYETANGLASDIQRHLNDEPVLAHAPSQLYRLQKMLRRNKLAFAAAGVMFAALAIGLGVSLWSLRKANREASRSQQVALFLQDMLKGVGPSKALGRDTVMLREILDKTAQRLDKELKNQPDVEADLRSTIGKVYFDLGQYTNAESMHREALVLRKKLLGNEHPDVASSLNNLANALRAQGRLNEAETLFREALAMRKKLLGSEHPEVASSLQNLAVMLADQGSLAEAETLFREALAMRKKLLGSEHQDLAISLQNLGLVLRKQGKLPEAETLFREALAMQKKLLGNEHPAVARSLDNLASVFYCEGKFAEAETLFREALAMRKKLLGSEHPEVARSLDSLASVFHCEGKIAEAETLYREALAMQKKLLGSEHPEVARSLDGIASVFYSEDKFTESETLYREALAMQRKLLGREHPDVATSLEGVALVLQEQGKWTEAETLQREALAIMRKRLGSEHLDVAQLLADLTRTLLLEEKFIEAEALAREYFAIYEKRLSEDWQTFDVRSLLGATLLGQKKYTEAEPFLITGYQGMKQREDKTPAGAKRHLKEVLQHLVQLYDATGKPEEAAKWKQELTARGL
jgi:eukaryotic-like serine/threonine-protein kinase